MNKRIFAMLMALAMIISMVPVTALAAEDHDCQKNGGGWISNGDVTHSSYCNICGELADGPNACQSFNGQTCYMCKGSMTAEPEEPVCDHEGGPWTPNGDGTHTSECECGAYSVSGQCWNLGSGKCYMCGYEFPVEEPECKHVNKGVVNKGENHDVVCRDCLDVLETKDHEYAENGICACGAIYVAPECQHVNKGVVNKGENHDVVCRDCEEVLDNEDHDYAMNGICACGAIKPSECDHEGGAWISKNDGTHYSMCECGLSVTEGECQNINGKCYMCGYVFPVDGPECDHENTGYAPIEGKPGYHDLVCLDCDYVNGFTFMKCESTDEDQDGICDKCGYQYKVVEPECEHVNKGVINKGENHDVVCRDCEEVLDNEDHEYTLNGICACGAIYVEPECEHVNKGVVNKGENHDVVCRDCEEVLDNEDHEYTLNGICACGAIYVEPECDHKGGAWTSNGDGTHTSSCECGQNVTEGPCYDLGKGVCYMCGYEFPVEHECTMDELVSISETQHQFQCECGEFVGAAMNHYDADGDNNCDGCGYTMFEVEHECTMDELVSISETQHQFQCECGEFVGVAMNHYDADGDNNCDGCGYTMYEVEECEHEWKGVIYRDETTHTVICRDCQEELVIETHTYQDNMPCVCGAINLETECEHEWKGVSYKNEATHNIVCRDCEEVLGVESHMYLNNMPCACGAIYSEPECEHEWKGVTYKDEATHTIVCRDCLEVLGVESHMYLNNMPCACGAIYSEPEHEHDWYESEIDEADCKHKGSIVWKCTGCDEEYTETLDVNPDNHVKMVRVRNIKAKCERGGYEVWFCFGCHEREVIKTEATGHNYQVSKENHKYIKYSCEDCGDYYIEKKAPEANERPSHGHHHWFSRFPFSKYFR